MPELGKNGPDDAEFQKAQEQINTRAQHAQAELDEMHQDFLETHPHLAEPAPAEISVEQARQAVAAAPSEAPAPPEPAVAPENSGPDPVLGQAKVNDRVLLRAQPRRPDIMVQATAQQQEHLESKRLHREFTAQKEPEVVPDHQGAYPASAPGDNAPTPAIQPKPPVEEGWEVLRGLKQLPSYWTPEAKRLAAKQAKRQAQISNPKEPLHRRAARFIGSKFGRKQGKHEQG